MTLFLCPATNARHNSIKNTPVPREVIRGGESHQEEVAGMSFVGESPVLSTSWQHRRHPEGIG